MRVLKVLNRARVSSVAYGRTGRLLVAAAGNRYHVWSLETFEFVRQAERKIMAGSAWECLFLTGGPAFLEANGYWDAGDELPGVEKRSQGHAQQVPNFTFLTGFLCFGPDGRSILRESFGYLWQSPQRLAQWDFGGACLRAYPLAGLVSPRYAAFSPDGAFLALGSSRGAVTLWDTALGAQVAQMEHTDQLYGLSFSPDGRRLATSAGRLVRVWSVPDGECVHRFRAFQAHTVCQAFSPDGRLLVAGARGGRARLWEVESGRELADHDWGQGDVVDVAFSPDGLTAAAACRKHAVVVWDIDV